MKRAGRLFDAVADRDNLRLAFYKALKGKRTSREAQRFGERLEENLTRMAVQLRDGTIPVGRHHQFVIHDPKERVITAPIFAERVMHHALMNVCEPVLDKWLIHDTYACRKGKGRDAALHQARLFAKNSAYFLKIDIRKYFDSVPHQELLARLERRIKDPRVLELFGRITRGFRGAIGEGLPIGSLTSQHLANFYLGWFDRHAKETLRLGGFVRYMDDMAIWGDSARELKIVLESARAWLKRELGLDIKANAHINRVKHGMDFLGCRVFPHHLTLNRRSRTRFARKLRYWEKRYESEGLSGEALQRHLAALLAFVTTRGISSWRFRVRAVSSPRVSGL